MGGRYRTPRKIGSGSSCEGCVIGLDLSSWDGWENASQDGSDIYILDEDGNPLYYWIEYYDYENQEGVIWVKLPHIEGGENIYIYLYYGGTNDYPEYHDPKMVFMIFEDFDFEYLDSGTGPLNETNIPDTSIYYKVKDSSNDGEWSIEITNSYMRLYCKDTSTGDGSDTLLVYWKDDLLDSNTNYKVKARVKFEKLSSSWADTSRTAWGLYDSIDSPTNFAEIRKNTYQSYNHLATRNEDGTSQSLINDLVPTSFKSIWMNIVWGCKVEANGGKYAHHDNYSHHIPRKGPSYYLKALAIGQYGRHVIMYIDWIFVAKYCANIGMDPWGESEPVQSVSYYYEIMAEPFSATMRLKRSDREYPNKMEFLDRTWYLERIEVDSAIYKLERPVVKHQLIEKIGNDLWSVCTSCTDWPPGRLNQWLNSITVTGKGGWIFGLSESFSPNSGYPKLKADNDLFEMIQKKLRERSTIYLTPFSKSSAKVWFAIPVAYCDIILDSSPDINLMYKYKELDLKNLFWSINRDDGNIYPTYMECPQKMFRIVLDSGTPYFIINWGEAGTIDYRIYSSYDKWFESNFKMLDGLVSILILSEEDFKSAKWWFNADWEFKYMDTWQATALALKQVSASTPGQIWLKMNPTNLSSYPHRIIVYMKYDVIGDGDERVEIFDSVADPTASYYIMVRFEHTGSSTIISIIEDGTEIASTTLTISNSVAYIIEFYWNEGGIDVSVTDHTGTSILSATAAPPTDWFPEFLGLQSANPNPVYFFNIAGWNDGGTITFTNDTPTEGLLSEIVEVTDSDIIKECVDESEVNFYNYVICKSSNAIIHVKDDESIDSDGLRMIIKDFGSENITIEECKAILNNLNKWSAKSTLYVSGVWFPPVIRRVGGNKFAIYEKAKIINGKFTILTGRMLKLSDALDLRR